MKKIPILFIILLSSCISVPENPNLSSDKIHLSSEEAYYMFKQEWKRLVKENKLPNYPDKNEIPSWTFSKNNIKNNFRQGLIDGWTFSYSEAVVFTDSTLPQEKMEKEMNRLLKDPKYSKYAEGFIKGMQLPGDIYDKAKLKVKEYYNKKASNKSAVGNSVPSSPKP